VSTPPHLHSDLILFFGYISNKSQKDVDELIGEPQGFFYTRVRGLLTYWLDWLNTYETGVILVVYEYVFIADLQCAFNDESINVVIYSLNANIHVYVHEDLNEIYLYNVEFQSEGFQLL
jgi:hypothetical protein